jgi:hypothetical protein
MKNGHKMEIIFYSLLINKKFFHKIKMNIPFSIENIFSYALEIMTSIFAMIAILIKEVILHFQSALE